MKIWGLTGNIACGKSAVEAMLRTAGCVVIDADQVARDVVEPGEPGLAEIVEAFGAEMLLPDGSLDRTALGQFVFSDPDARKRLEEITHPRIHTRIAERLGALAQQGCALAVVSAALMVESGSYRNYAGLLVVTCPEDLQIARLRARDGLSEADARSRIDSQLPQGEKVALADEVIDNGGDLSTTGAQVRAWLDRLQSEGKPGAVPLK